MKGDGGQRVWRGQGGGRGYRDGQGAKGVERDRGQRVWRWMRTKGVKNNGGKWCGGG